MTGHEMWEQIIAMSQSDLGRFCGKARQEEHRHINTYIYRETIHFQRVSKTLKGKNSDEHQSHCV